MFLVRRRKALSLGRRPNREENGFLEKEVVMKARGFGGERKRRSTSRRGFCLLSVMTVFFLLLTAGRVYGQADFALLRVRVNNANCPVGTGNGTLDLTVSVIVNQGSSADLIVGVFLSPAQIPSQNDPILVAGKAAGPWNAGGIYQIRIANIVLPPGTCKYPYITVLAATKTDPNLVNNTGFISNPCFPCGPNPTPFVRGDVNHDARFNISDCLDILWHLHIKPVSEISDCEDAADANDDGKLGLADAIYLLNWLFTGQEGQPSAPFPECGADPTADGLSCKKFPCRKNRGERKSEGNDVVFWTEEGWPTEEKSVGLLEKKDQEIGEFLSEFLESVGAL